MPLRPSSCKDRLKFIRKACANGAHPISTPTRIANAIDVPITHKSGDLIRPGQLLEPERLQAAQQPRAEANP
ncbi:MAG: hypothetical protein R2748_22360 [Bryobacterales bacterium]